MTPEIAAFVVIVFLFVVLLFAVRLRAHQRQADQHEIENRKPVFRALEGERDTVLDEPEQQTDNAVTSFICKLNTLLSRESEQCPYCGAHVEALEQVGRSVYAFPCGCRQGQGNVPEVWKK
jgi:hypothetical protein